ncbi:hypothetical protein QT987_10515 [Microcoleus sp. SVA1B4]
MNHVAGILNAFGQNFHHRNRVSRKRSLFQGYFSREKAGIFICLHNIDVRCDRHIW